MKYPRLIAALPIACALLGLAPNLRADEVQPPSNRIKIAENTIENDPREESPFVWAAENWDDEDGAGPRFSFGRVFSDGLKDGYFGRFESEWFTHEGIGIFGALVGLEGFGGPDGGGGAVPASIFVGIRAPLIRHERSPCFFMSAGLGADLLLIDYIAEDFGLGIAAPFAAGTAGIELFPGARFLLDARVQYRWQWGAVDRGYARLGFTLAINSDWWDNSDGGPPFSLGKTNPQYNQYSYNNKTMAGGASRP